MIKRIMKGLVLVLALGVSSLTIAADTTGQMSFTPTQKTEIQKVVKNYLLNNPEILVEVSRKLQEKQLQTMEMKAKKAIIANAKSLTEDPNSPVIGNPNGKVTLVEFFDFACMFCRRSAPVLEGLVKQDPNLRVVFKNLPVMGASSHKAAIAGVYVQMKAPKKYMQFHHALLHESKPLTDAKIVATAKKVGVTTTDLARILKSNRVPKDIEDQVGKEFKLATMVGINGTPSFVVLPTDPAKANDKTVAFVPGIVKQPMSAFQVYLANLVKKISQQEK